ncbi:MAG: glycerol-3-phosphate dehydrogenase/oxidase [Melioribacteraceae bacterium]|nr:glycerol-3-phosphate dehydrogenase/oxidase [Melioribacteraceae bacterium]
MNRESLIERIENEKGYWDIVVIGGGATGLGAAVEASSRGYKTLLLEQHDFSKGTSSRSTKLVHGGVRYLQQGNVSLVLEALHERGLLKQNAPHLVFNQSFVVPNYDWWDGPFYGIGMKLYDLLAGKLGLGPSKILSREETIEQIPNVEPEGLKGGVIYYDGQFDDSRLAINLAQTVLDHNGTVINYMEVTGLIKNNNKVSGVIVIDKETGREYTINSRVVINATGVFTDSVIKMDNPHAKKIIAVSQGVHIILDKEFLPGDSAIMVPQTDDGRVLFAVPWHNKVVVGTTDTEIEEASLEPRALEEEIDFILTHAKRYMKKDPTRSDVKSVFAGLRPLVRPAESKSTASISRDHYLTVSNSGLVTITGGKWTTYRKMGEDTINEAAKVAGLEEKPSITQSLRIHGWLKNIDNSDPLYFYGSDTIAIKKLVENDKYLGEQICKQLPYIGAEVVWHIRNEMARSIEDVLARRTRSLFLDAKASIEMAPAVAKILASELGKSSDWEKEQIKEYTNLAKEYLLN